MRINFNEILVVKLRHIGDVLLATPLLRVLRESFPQARITMLVNPGTESVLKNNSCLDEIVLASRENWVQQAKFLRYIRARHFDCVIDLSDGDRSAFLTAVSGARARIGFNNECRWRGKVYSWSLDRQYGSMHMLDYHAQTLIPLGVEPRICSPELNISEDESQLVDRILIKHGLKSTKWAALHPGARYWFKAWPTERFAAIGDALVNQGFQVVIVGDTDERNLVDEITKLTQQNIISLVGKTSVRELAALLKQCNLFIGNDAGPMHIAAAVGCPVVGLFGPTDPAVWGPYGNMCQTIYKGLDCHECFYPGCFRGEGSCMKLISVEEVFQVAENMLLGN